MESKRDNIKYQKEVEDLKSMGLIIKDYDLYLNNQRKNITMIIIIFVLYVLIVAFLGYLIGYEEGLTKGTEIISNLRSE